MSCGKPCNCPSYREHCLSVSISGTGLPTRKPEVLEVAAREDGWNKDMPAYRRMRDEGLQPAHIDGSHEMEAKATDRFEIESGRRWGSDLSMAKDITEALNPTLVKS